ncbi:hypothetical protein HF072_19530 [Bacillus sp. RO3]|nr:hypothetical protein [Bacillus sp. RO3]
MKREQLIFEEALPNIDAPLLEGIPQFKSGNLTLGGRFKPPNVFKKT